MIITKSKSSIKTKLKVEQTDRATLCSPDAIFLDECAILWMIQWPTHGLVQDLIKNLVGYILIDMKPDDTYLITDRYYDKNIKK